MKTIILALLALMVSGVMWGQVKIEDKKIYLDADSKVKFFETVIEYKEKKKMKCKFKNVNENAIVVKKDQNTYALFLKNSNNHSISIKRNANMPEPLQVNVLKNSTDTNFIPPIFTQIDSITFQRNTEYTFTVKGIENNTEIERVYKIKTQTNKNWSATFGANAIFYINRDKFISKKTDNDTTHHVVKVQDRNSMDLMPAVMFTFMNNQKDFSVGTSAGLGFNLEELAAFGGVSLGIGQNLILTGGIAVHMQNRPNNNFHEGQIIDSAITTDMLNEKQYRVNPFVSLSFRFNKNPFKS
ncbi:hypothetical protein [Kaistella sp.]|uniref:hypothetical protein n=1 Tax=Kaistella sp. TaxID=2782235 RepID=UPI003C35B1C6